MSGGGITIGRLFHNSEVVFGAGLVDAYELERKADDPRVIVSQEIHECIKSYSDPLACIYEDAKDGKWCLKYLGKVLEIAWRLNTEASDASSKEWKTSSLSLIDKNIENFKKNEEKERKNRGKWEWFKTELEAAIEKRPGRFGEN